MHFSKYFLKFLSYKRDLYFSHPYLQPNMSLPDYTALVTVIPLHVKVTVVGDGKDMRRHFTYLLVSIEADLITCVDGQKLVRVDSHEDGASVCLHIEEKDKAKLI